MGATSVESQTEILTQAIESCLTLRAILATGNTPDLPVIADTWDHLLRAGKLCAQLSLEAQL
jgi:hypothetical protein